MHHDFKNHGSIIDIKNKIYKDEKIINVYELFSVANHSL